MASNLHKLHAKAHAKAQGALDIFRGLAADLRAAADDHDTVAEEAKAHAVQYNYLAESAEEARDNALRQARAISSLVG